MVKHLILSILISPCFFNPLFAQGWEYLHPVGLNFNNANDVVETIDGGFVLVGRSMDIGPISGSDALIIKLDQDGEEQWQKYYRGFSSFFNEAFAIDNTSDGGFIVVGSTDVSAGAEDDEKIYLLRLDAAGDTLWTKTYQNFEGSVGRDVQQTPDGGFVITGSWGLGGSKAITLLKTDSEGIIIWQQIFQFNGIYMEGYSLDQTDDGGYIIAGMRAGQLYLLKTDLVGDTLWTRTLLGGEGDLLTSLEQTTDGGYIVGGAIGGFAGESPFVAKTDAAGNEEWTAFAEPTWGLGRTTSVKTTTDGGYIVTGTTPFMITNNTGFLTKLDAAGNTTWSHILNEDLQAGGNSVSQTSDGGYIVAGFANNATYAIKTDTLGNAFSVYLQGQVYHDPDLECDTDDAPFTGLENWIVQATGDGGDFYTLTDENGNYEMAIDTGTFSITAVPPNSLWTLCEGPVVQNFPSFYDTIQLDFFVEAAFICPLMTVDISTPFLRRCMSNTYYVNVCNEGTITAIDASLDVDFDPFLTVNSATIPWTSQNGNTYSFPLGDVDHGSCLQFSVHTTLSCEAVLGQTHCTEAHAYPDSLCVVDPLWDMSSVEVEAFCEADSIRFIIRNSGDGNMSESQQYLVIEDQIILFQDAFMLNASEEISIKVPANGSTWRLEAEQSAGHPGFSMPSVTVEGCVDPPSGIFSMGFVIQYPEDDVNSFLSFDCRENIGSYDPNDKSAFPKGYGQEHFVTQDQELEYLIRFQNTGTDTAFKVVIRDAIPEFLDMATIRPGASSHPYNLSIINNVLKFNFNDINLPDSTINLEASNGFVKFRIGQRDGNEIGTIIENTADIYFDFNAPVSTNQVFHTVGEDFVEIVVGTIVVHEPGYQVVVAPNPFSELTRFLIQGPVQDKLSLLVYNSTGQLMAKSNSSFSNEIIFNRGNLSSGIYFFRILDNGRDLFSGKMVVE